MRVDQCLCSRRGGGADILADPFVLGDTSVAADPFVLGDTSVAADPFVLGDTSVARIPVGCHQVTPGILDDLCCLPYVAAASGWAEVDTGPLINGGCSQVTEVAGPYGL